MQANPRNDELYSALKRFREKILPIFPYHLIKIILDLTKGEIFLTKKLCDLIIAERLNILDGEQEQREWVDNLVSSKIINNWEQNEAAEHLRKIANSLGGFGNQNFLNLYREVMHRNVSADNSLEQKQLLDLGLISVDEQNNLRVANHIYKEVFNENWVDQKLKINQPPTPENIMPDGQLLNLDSEPSSEGMNPFVSGAILSLIGVLIIFGTGWFIFGSKVNDPQSLCAGKQIYPNSNKGFEPPKSVPTGTKITVQGSTSMAKINKKLKDAFVRNFEGTTVSTTAEGSSEGIGDILKGDIDIAAVSRPLNELEQKRGLIAVPVTQDRIALVVGKDNPHYRSLTEKQVRDIFQGKITNWSELGGQNALIKVFNRPSISGTRQVFQQLVLQEQSFGETSNITTLKEDGTTKMLRLLGNNGIGYATNAQLANQSTVRTLPIDGLTPESDDYPYVRLLCYVYKNPPTEEGKAFLGFVSSDQGKDAIREAMQDETE